MSILDTQGAGLCLDFDSGAYIAQAAAPRMPTDRNEVIEVVAAVADGLPNLPAAFLAEGDERIAGLGHIGKDVALRAKAFGLHPIAWSRGLTPSRANEIDGWAASMLPSVQQHLQTARDIEKRLKESRKNSGDKYDKKQ